MTTFEREEDLKRCVEALSVFSHLFRMLVVIDNSVSRFEEPNILGSNLAAFKYIWNQENVGLPAAIAAGFRVIGPNDHVLILDDDTIFNEGCFRHFVSCLTSDDSVHAVTVPRAFTRSAQSMVDKDILFPWSPTLISAEARATVGNPVEELWFGYGDWEFALRMADAGLKVKWTECDLEQFSKSEEWDGRIYLAARNLTYMYIYLGHRTSIVRRQLRRFLWDILRDSERRMLLIRGIGDGIWGRMGQPPREFIKKGS